MVKNFGMEIKFACLRQCFLKHALKLLDVNETAANKKYDIIQVSIESPVQFAEGNAVGVGDEDFQVPKLTDANRSFLTTFRQRDKTLQRYRFDMNSQFLANLHDGSMQVARIHIIAEEVNVNRRARTS